VPLNENGVPDFLHPPVFGIRPGFSYAPFWSVLVGNGDCYSDDCCAATITDRPRPRPGLSVCFIVL
jgi:hypothetical protein